MNTENATTGTEITLKVEGMTCANCAMAISRKLEKKGLRHVSVDFAAGEVHYTESNEYGNADIQKDIESMGYTVVPPQSTQTSFWQGKTERLFLFCSLFTLPLLLHMVWPQSILANPYVQLILCLPVLASGGLFFLRSAISSLKNGVPNMDVLISLGAFSAFIYSSIGLFILNSVHEHKYLFFETSASIITLVLLGNVIEKRSVKKTGSALESLAALLPSIALRITESGNTEEIPSAWVKAGDRLLVREGEKIPADGRVTDGTAWCDESMITGESMPVALKPEMPVKGGTIISNGNITIKAEGTGKQAYVYRIVEWVKKAQSDKPPVQKLADRVSAVFVPIVLGLAGLTFMLNYYSGISAEESMMRSIAVLVISCPCAMGLATPTAVAVGIGNAAKNGILFRSATAAQSLAEAKILVFDKTGTLTQGAFEVNELILTEHPLAANAKSIIYTMELASTHPIAQSLCRTYQDAGKFALRNCREIKGVGMEAFTENGEHLTLGAPQPNDTIEADLVLKANGAIVAGMSINDRVKAGVAETLLRFKNVGYRLVLLSGDRTSKCEILAKQLDISEVYGGCTPDKKLAVISALKKEGKVLMYGDGINDGPALNAADVSVSHAGASDLASHSASVLLHSQSDFKALYRAIELGKKTLRTIRQNLFWAFFYNIIAIPLAALGMLNPAIAALAMAGSDVMVVGNALRLGYLIRSQKDENTKPNHA
jgi:Cu+-exporting ATPase